MITPQTVKAIVSAVLFVAIAGGIYFAWDGYKRDMAELESLRTYKTSVENREEVSGAARGSYQAQKADAANQAAANETQRIIIENRTIEVAREDQATADFLDMPIPQRLRDADREARLTRGLGSGERAHGGAGQAD